MCWCEFTFNQPGTLINNGVNNGTSRLFTRTPTIELCRCCSSVVAGRVRADWACQDQIRVKTSWRDCRICRLQSITKMLLLTLLPDRSACDFFALCEIFVFWLMFLFRSNICYSTSSFFLCFFLKTEAVGQSRMAGNRPVLTNRCCLSPRARIPFRLVERVDFARNAPPCLIGA